MIHPDFFFFFLVKIVVGIFITRNWWLDVVASIKILAIRLVNDPLDLFPYYHDLHIAYRQHLSMQRLQNAVPPKQHWNSELGPPWLVPTLPLCFGPGSWSKVLPVFISLALVTPSSVTLWSNLAACSHSLKNYKLYGTSGKFTSK